MSDIAVDVRRLAAVDLTGVTGQVGRRAQLVRVEFIASAALGLAFGGWFLADGAPAWLGLWSVGVGVNYLALSLHAIDLLRHPHRLHAELDGVDVGRELRRYSATQLLLVVPFLVAVAAAIQHAHTGRAVRSDSDSGGDGAVGATAIDNGDAKRP